MSETTPTQGEGKRPASGSIDEKVMRANRRVRRARRQADAAQKTFSQARDELSESRSKREAAERNLSLIRLEFQLGRVYRRLSLPKAAAQKTVAVLDRPGLRLLASPLLFLLDRAAPPPQAKPAKADPADAPQRPDEASPGNAGAEDAGTSPEDAATDTDPAALPLQDVDAVPAEPAPEETAADTAAALPASEPLVPASEPLAAPEAWRAEVEERGPLAWVRSADLALLPEDAALRRDGAVLGLASPGERAAGLAESLDLFALLSGRAGGSSGPGEAVDPKSAVRLARLLPEGLDGEGAPRLGDVWLATDRLLRLRLEDIPADFVLRAFQYNADSRTLRLADETAVAKSGACFADIRLTRPLMPVLLVVSDLQGTVAAAGLLPFPSLCRGGLHFPELLAALAGGDYLEALAAYSRRRLADWAAGLTEGGFALGSIAVDLRSALGTEPIFSRDMREWLLAAFQIRLEPLAGSGGPRSPGENYLAAALSGRADEDRAARGGRGRLCLNAHSVPTLAALTHRGGLPRPAGSRAALPFLIAGAAGDAAWFEMDVPSSAAALSSLQSGLASIPFPVVESDGDAGDGASDANEPAAAEGSASGFPWVVARRDRRFVQEANLFFPVAPDGADRVIASPALTGRARRLLAVLPVRERVLDRLAGLGRQDWNGEVVPIVLMRHAKERQDAGVLLERNLGNIQFTVSILSGAGRWGVSRAIGKLDGDAVMLFSEGVALHDRRTLDTLAAVALNDGVATAGCAFLHEALVAKRRQMVVHSTGFLPAAGAEGGTVLAEADYSPFLPPGTYPVAMNSPSLFMSARRAWDDMQAAGELNKDGALAGAELAEAAARRGLAHLCTSLVTAGWSLPPKPRLMPVSDEVAGAVKKGAIRFSALR